MTPEPPTTYDHKPEITPETPTFTLPRCEGDEFIAPTVTLPANTEILNYRWGAQKPPFTSVPLTVEVYPGTVNQEEEWVWTEEWANDPPDGWRVEPGSPAVFTVKFKDVPCAAGPEPIVPETPVVKSAECVDGGLTKPTITLPADGAATYELHRLEPGRSYVVKARVTDGYRWASWEFPDGWVDHGRRLATYTVTFDEVSCEPVAEQPTQPGQLAATGPGDAAVLGGAALLTVAAGVSLIVARRRVMGR
ncbi:hypothetical protein ACQEVI_08045 [Promicromonospora sp. CA-289599]|uniref:hypothetical protein n=1 Tax=Promicromonospora sp. CA-289599 TaxID=3240014 RepID=UPI003D8B728D